MNGSLLPATQKVWELVVNPDVEREPIPASKPRRPEPKDVRKGQPGDLENPQAQEFIDYSDLAPIELTILQLNYAEELGV